MPYWAGTILCAATLAFNAIAIIKTATTADIVTDIEERLNQNTTSEKSHIQTVTVTAEKNPKYNTPAGSNTQDKIFLLSISEAETYFGKNGPCGDGSCEMTDWARYKLSYLDHVSKSWWLRTPGQNNQKIAYYIDDIAIESGSDFDFCTGVRPAMWISLNS